MCIEWSSKNIYDIANYIIFKHSADLTSSIPTPHTRCDKKETKSMEHKKNNFNPHTSVWDMTLKLKNFIIVYVHFNFLIL